MHTHRCGAVARDRHPISPPGRRPSSGEQLHLQIGRRQRLELLYLVLCPSDACAATRTDGIRWMGSPWRWVDPHFYMSDTKLCERGQHDVVLCGWRELGWGFGFLVLLGWLVAV